MNGMLTSSTNTHIVLPPGGPYVLQQKEEEQAQVESISGPHGVGVVDARA
jgi:hypothetical protein